MSLESFYGGKQGLSSIIKKSFRYISENDPAFKSLSDDKKEEALNNNEVMETCLSDANYETVWYGELCIINTVNKNNPANGCLFRRTLSRQGTTYPIEIYDTNNELIENSNLRLSAEYIGQIVGPASGTPYVNITTLEGVDAVASKKYGPYDETVYEEKVTGDKIYNTQLNDIENQIDTFVHEGISEGIFIPGSVDGQDDIRYNWFNVRKNDENDTQSWVYLGLKIPYLVQDTEFATVDYWVTPQRYNKAIDPETHQGRKFYQNWHIDIPKGVKGNGISNIRLTTCNKEQTNNIYQNFNAIIHNDNDDTYIINIDAPKVTGRFLQQQITNDGNMTIPDEETILDAPFYVCDFTIYNSTDNNSKGQTATIYLGMPKDIKNIELQDDGSVIIHYKDQSSEKFDQIIKWIKEVNISSAVANINPGQISIKYNYGEDDVYELGLPNKAKFDKNTGIFTFGTSDGNKYNLKSDYNAFSHVNVEDTVDINPKNQQWYEIQNNSYVLTEDETYQENKDYYEIPDFKFRYPVNVTLRGDATANNENQSRQLAIEYNISNERNQKVELIGDGINYVQDIVLINDIEKPYNGHLLILFNDPMHRPHTNDLNGNNQWKGKTWYNNIQGTIVSPSENLYWWDVGSPIGYYNGNLIGENLVWNKDIYTEYISSVETYNPQELGLYEKNNEVYILTIDTTNIVGKKYYKVNSSYIYDNVSLIESNAIERISTYLNTKYPYGLTNINLTEDDNLQIINRQGMMVTCVLQSQDKNNLNKYNVDITYYFAFDYNDKNWQLIQSFTSLDVSKMIDIKIDGFSYPNDLDLRSEGSTFMRYVATNTKATALTAPWLINGVYSLNN